MASLQVRVLPVVLTMNNERGSRNARIKTQAGRLGETSIFLLTLKDSPMKFLLAIVLCSIATHAQAQVQYHVAIINAYAMRTNNSPPQDLIEAEAIGIVVPSRDAKVIWRVFVPGQSKSSYVTEELFPAGSEIYSWQTWEAPKKHPTSPDLLLRQQEEQS